MPGNRRQVVHLPLTSRIKDGRIFEVSTRCNSGVTYLRCRTRFCSGTAKIMPNTDEIVNGRRHSQICYEDRDAQLKANFNEALKSSMTRNYWKLKEVYETVAALFPAQIKLQIPYHSIKSSLKRWRRCNYPACPESLEEMANQLSQPEHQRLIEYDVGRLTCRKVHDTDGKLHVLLYDENFVRNNFTNVSKIFIDGTFQTTPRVTGVYQLVSVLGVKYDHAIPFAHILMGSKTQAAYMAVLGVLRNQLINEASVQVAITDFEQALRNACRLSFSNAHVVGCNVQYDRAILKKIKSSRLAPLLREDDDAKMFIKKILALAFLPPEMIEREYALLKNDLSLVLKRRLSTFIVYYERQWLQVVKPGGFSVYGLSRRTNNVIESYNSILADKLGEHPSGWTFVEKIVKLTSNARDDVQSLRLGKNISRHPRYSTIYKNRELKKAWRQLHLNEITAAEFIDKAAALKGRISQRLMHMPDNVADDDDTDVVHTQFNIHDDPDFDNEIFTDIAANVFINNDAEANEAENQEVDNMLEPQEFNAGIMNVEEIPENPPAVEAVSPDALSELSEIDEIDDSVHRGDSDVGDALEWEMNDSDVDLPIFQVDDDATNEAGAGPSMAPLDQPNQRGELAEDLRPVERSAEQPQQRVSASRKRNLRKKRRRQMLAQDVPAQVRPYGHKRRKPKRVPKCVICQGNPITHGFVPCGHYCCCGNCATAIAAGPRRHCPKCRTPFREVLQIFHE